MKTPQATEIYARFAEEVYDDFGDSRQEQEYYRKEHADRYIAHINRKRCEAMAAWCEAMRGHYLSYEEPKWFWYRKWSEHWLELAEHYRKLEEA